MSDRNNIRVSKGLDPDLARHLAHILYQIPNSYHASQNRNSPEQTEK